MSEEFATIKAPEEIARILKLAETLKVEVYGEVTESVNSPVVELDIRGISGTKIVLGLKREPGEPVRLLSGAFPNGLKAGSRVEIIFGLVDGQYAIRDVVEDVSLSTFTVSAENNLLRLQRRKDFRVAVRNEGLKFFKVEKSDSPKPRGDAKPFEYSLLDLSAGGLRLLWPTSVEPVPALGTVIQGTLRLSPEKSVDVAIRLVKNHGIESAARPDLGYALSFQFQNLPQEEARAVLFTCLFIHRGSYGTR